MFNDNLIFFMKTALPALAVISALVSCGCKDTGAGFTEAEKSLILSSGQVMRVLTVTDPQDSLFLRESCTDLSVDDIMSDTYARLAELMVATVTSPEQDGVGIAGPQVGIGRRIVAVQRYDKQDMPFEVYPNVSIIAVRGDKQPGGEGCLSVPDRYGEVERWQDIDIRYVSPKSGADTVENVKGYSAVIFQHETDHLDGVLYIDRIIN